MGYLVRMPQMGMSMDEGTVVEWAVEEGGAVEEGETVVVVESEKAQADVEARETGVLRRVLVRPGDVVEPGDPIGVVAGEDEDLSDLEAEIEGDGTDAHATEPADDEPGASTSGSDDDAGTQAAAVEATPGARKLAAEEGVDLAGIEGSGPGGAVVEDDVGDAIGAGGAPAGPDTADVKATPGARRLAEETGVSLASVDGSGPGDVITEDDVRAAADEAPDEAAPQESGQEPADTGDGPRVGERRTLSGTQATISRRLSQSYRNAVHVTLNRTVDTSALDDHVGAARTLGMAHGYNDLILKATADALTGHPGFNAHFEDDEHVLFEDVNVCVAVDTDDGLVAPVIPNVDERGLTEINEARTALTERVMAGEFTMADLSGGTFTISNLGMFGVDHFDPVINPPQVAILGVGRRREDATMTLSLSFDHRVENGAAAAKFLGSIADNLTDAETLSGYLS